MDTVAEPSTSDLGRLLAPRSIAVVGSSRVCGRVVEQNRALGFRGPIWPVHPSRSEIAGVPCFPSLDALPGVPDSTFLGVNRHITVQSVRTSRRITATSSRAICASTSSPCTSIADSLVATAS